MSEWKIVESSPEAKKMQEKVAGKPARQSYPFKALEVGQSFTVPIEKGKYQSLRVRCSQLSTEGKKFTAVLHKEMGIIEVARIN